MSSDSSKTQADRSAADLKLVAEPIDFGHEPKAGASESDPRSGAAFESGGRPVLPIWLFVLGLVFAAVVIGWQARLAGELTAEVADLEQQLDHTNTLLEAHRDHLGEIRGGVTDLSERLAGLRQLVEGGPATPPPSTP
ncbi:MAG: hypothetical protein VCB25_05370 [Myxococcota bacterium]